MRSALRYVIIFLGSVFVFLFLWILAGPSVLKVPAMVSSAPCGILAAEGWLPEPVLKSVASAFQRGCYDRLIVTGVTLPDQVEMLFKGRLILHPAPGTFLQPGDTLFLKMSGTPALGQQPAGTILINDAVAATYTAPRKPDWIAVPVKDSFPETASICISFDNDAWTRYADRNLSVHALKIHGKVYLPRSLRAFYIRCLEQETDTVDLNFSSVPGQAAWFFHRDGIPYDKMDIVPVLGIHTDKTWHSMKALADYIRKNYPGDSSVVIFTHPFHARRTLMLARKAFGTSIKVHIVTSGLSPAWWRNGPEIKMFIKESAGLFWMVFHNPANEKVSK